MPARIATFTQSHYPEPYDNSSINSRLKPDGTQRSASPSPTTPAVNTSVSRPKNIWRDFFQTREGNCATVSAIKAAMVRFGHEPSSIFKKIVSTHEGYEVTMRDSVKVTITHTEINKAKEKSGFSGRGRVLTHAIFLYAVSAKRAQKENNDGWARHSFEAALRTLNDGEHPNETLIRLGLKDHMRIGTVQDLKNGAIGTLSNHLHSVAVIDGFMDMWGTKRQLSGSSWEESPAAYILV